MARVHDGCNRIQKLITRFIYSFLLFYRDRVPGDAKIETKWRRSYFVFLPTTGWTTCRYRESWDSEPGNARFFSLFASFQSSTGTRRCESINEMTMAFFLLFERLERNLSVMGVIEFNRWFVFNYCFSFSWILNPYEMVKYRNKKLQATPTPTFSFIRLKIL